MCAAAVRYCGIQWLCVWDREGKWTTQRKNGAIFETHIWQLTSRVISMYLYISKWICIYLRHLGTRHSHEMYILYTFWMCLQMNGKYIVYLARYTNLYSYKYYLKTEFIHAYIYTLWNDIGYYRKFSILARFYIRYINKSLSTLIYFDLDFIKRYFQSFMYKFLLRITVAFVVVIELILIW